MKKGILSNKLRYIINNNNSKFSVNILLLIKVGSIHETKKKYGLAHYFEHMLFKGTKQFPKSKLITDEIYKYGGIINAFTSYEYTGYYITINSKYTEKAIGILSDIFYNSIFIDYIKEKDVVISENKTRNSDPQNLCCSKFEDLIYKNTPYHHNVIGLNSDIKKFTKKDIKNFYDKHYIPSNCIVSISGRINNNVEKLIKKYFSKNTRNKKKINNNPIIYKPVLNFMNIQKKERTKIIKKNIGHAHVYMGYPCYNYQNKFKKYVLDVISTILAGNMSSRLFIKLREEHGLVYTVTSSTDYSFDVGIFEIYYGTYNSKINKVSKLILDEIDKIKKYGFTNKELKRCIDYIILTNEMSSENNESINIQYAYELMYFNKITTLKYDENIYRKITNNDIIEVANEIFNKNKLNKCIVGKF